MRTGAVGVHTRTVTTDMDDEEMISQVVEKLAAKNPEIPKDQVETTVREEFAGLAGRPVRDYLSVLTERAAKKRLKKSARD